MKTALDILYIEHIKHVQWKLMNIENYSASLKKVIIIKKV